MQARNIFTASLVGSAVVFLAHKVEGRFETEPDKTCDPKWSCQFPGLIVTHKPWNLLMGVFVCIIYLILAGGIIMGVDHLARTVSQSDHAPLARAALISFSALWVGWAMVEGHHSIRDDRSSPRRPGAYYGNLFTQYMLALYVPATIWFLMRTY